MVARKHVQPMVFLRIHYSWGLMPLVGPKKVLDSAMRYCFANWVDSPEGGQEPLLPENHGFLLLADFGPNTPWAIFDVRFVEDEPVAVGLERVPDDLGILLDSARAYSPAMAIARDDMTRHWQGRSPSRSEFAASLAEALRQQLRAQPESRYRLARAVVDELGYLAKGEYAWIVGYDSVSHEVSWVSSDFHVYKNPAGDFDLNVDELGRLLQE